MGEVVWARAVLMLIRKGVDCGLTTAVTLASVIALVPLFSILLYVTYKGLGTVLTGGLSIFTELPPPPMVEGGGLGPAIVGTLIVVSIGAAISIPIGIMSAIYLSEFSAGEPIAYWIRFFTNVLAGVPSIIAGVFSFGLIVLTTKTFSAVAGGAALSVLMVPVITLATEEALRLVPQDMRQAAYGLGSTSLQTVTKVVLPTALPTIVTGITLAIARAAGETAPLIFTALFSQFYLPFDTEGPGALFNQPIASLSVLIYNFALVPFENQQKMAWAASLVLLGMVLISSIIARTATRRNM
ncbi:MAG: phosphate ABC transporter permease PstA [Gloeomargaritaceae cyanobacterium C42_A2020_066]|nr:phosphate ABC transporter permease PstA [Gloeomargaritaceae cyanobacterium C42_A2020_066]